LASGLPEDAIKEWALDPQVTIDADKVGSVFDQLEDMDTNPCLDKLLELANLNAGAAAAAADALPEAALVFIKPHACFDATKTLVAEHLKAHGISIVNEGTIEAKDIDEKKLIDNHYYSIASKATIMKPADLNVPADKFQDTFGVAWDQALSEGKVFNALEGCAHLGIDAEQMAAAWTIAKESGKFVKFGGGFYCGLVAVDGKDPVYIFNGFFMSMRSKFTSPGAAIQYYSVQWDGAKLPWASFRAEVLGATDPTKAPAGSLRGLILQKWKDLGLPAEPDVGDNGVHGSASPLEGLAERANWLATPVAEDTFGARLVKAGLTEDLIKAWCKDPQVTTADGKTGSVFDQLEDMNSAPCVDRISELVALNKA